MRWDYKEAVCNLSLAHYYQDLSLRTEIEAGENTWRSKENEEIHSDFSLEVP